MVKPARSEIMYLIVTGNNIAKFLKCTLIYQLFGNCSATFSLASSLGQI